MTATTTAGASVHEGREPFAHVALDAWLMTRRNLYYFTRLPILIFFSAVQPVIFVLLFRYVFGGAIHVPGHSYVDYLLPGIFAQTAAFGSFATAVGLATDLQRGVIDRFRSLPISRSAVLIGRLASDSVRNFFVVLLMLAIGYLVGFRIHTNMLAAIAMVFLSLLFGLAISTVSAAIALAIKDPESVQSFGLVWLFPLTFASAVFVPIQAMPGWLQGFARVNPITVCVNALRDLTLGGPAATHVWQTIVWSVAIIAVFAPLAVRAYRRAS